MYRKQLLNWRVSSFLNLSEKQNSFCNMIFTAKSLMPGTVWVAAAVLDIPKTYKHTWNEEQVFKLRLIMVEPHQCPLHQFIWLNQGPIPEIFTKNIENWRNWKTLFFWVGHYDFFFQKYFFFCSIPSKFLAQQGWVQILMITICVILPYMYSSVCIPV